MDEAKNHPTMIIPDGTDVSVDDHGLLSIKTPGNLVLQNSGRYGALESTDGSVRIDPDVAVEAVWVHASDTCFIAGELTAWRVRSKKIILEKSARANIMLQESESVELDRAARLVGNFASPAELSDMLERFSRQLDNLKSEVGSQPAEPAPEPDDEPFISPDGEDEPSARERKRADTALATARMVLERELGRPKLDDAGRRALEKLLDLAQKRDVAALAEDGAFLISQVPSPSNELTALRDVFAGLEK